MESFAYYDVWAVTPGQRHVPMFGSTGEAEAIVRSEVAPEAPGKTHPSRIYVSAERVYYLLRTRMRCTETGERGPACSYWRTADGLRFRLDDPVADSASVPVWHAHGSRRLVYSYQYARQLLRTVNAMRFDRLDG